MTGILEVIEGSGENAPDFLNQQDWLDPHTSGPWQTEREVCIAFDERVANLRRWFTPYAEVRGKMLLPNIGQSVKGSLRIDRLLVPTNELLARGWEIGPVGVEIKKPNKAIGPAVSQLLDYSHCAWQIKKAFWIVPEWYFLFHLKTAGGSTGSIMAQHRIGGLYIESRHQDLIFDSIGLLGVFGSDGHIKTLGKQDDANALVGKKAGSR